ncbi:hypothetical protein FSP39_001149 [Pinctada imbricata]|uniref:B box-type domain-containing protein n=1 Tax=Pinctada imbricata TaxID=66713 RepID=A0AA88YGZ7_PINIB|nr:hypothetical protein FSP39_001149 [Pinctada imbricata]
MASGTNEFQYAILTCTEQSNEELFSYCNTCHTQICELCVKGEHKKHDWTSTSKHARKLRREAKAKSDKIRTEILPFMEANTEKARKKSNRIEITQTGQAFKASIDVYMQYLLSINDVESDRDQEMEAKMDEFTKLATFFEVAILTASDNVVLEMEEEYNKKMDEHRQTANKVLGFKSFQKGLIVEETMKYMFGRIRLGNKDDSQISGSIHATFNFGKKTISTIWQNLRMRHGLRFTDNGQATMKQRFVAGDVACDSQGRIFLTDMHNKAIFILTADVDFLRYFFREEADKTIPCSLSLKKDSLWV